MSQKTVLAIEDMTCFGKCSLTEALPVISAAGISLSVLPTALFSTHTGGYGSPETADLSGFLKPAINHWVENKITFDGVYCGYFSEISQIEIIKENIKTLCKRDGIIIVDPVMGDGGKLYNGITADFPEKMLCLCRMADVIVPNVTEACLLCGTDYKENYDEEFICELANRLHEMTGADVVITGVETIPKKIGVAVLSNGEYSLLQKEKTEGKFHGTGDIFASLLTAELINGENLKTAAEKCAEFVSLCIKETVNENIDERQGLCFEKALKYILKKEEEK